MSGSRALPPMLETNGQFMRDFLAASPPCCAMGLVQKNGQRQYALFALRPSVQIPSHIAYAGGGLGIALLGPPPHEVVCLGFQFPELATYYLLVNPSNPLIRAVLTTLLDTGNTVFLALTSGQDVIGLKTDTEAGTWQELAENRRRILESTTTMNQYQQIVRDFHRGLEPPGQLLDWVCRNPGYLDLTQNRWEMKTRAH
jgi:hypothetical protein